MDVSPHSMNTLFEQLGLPSTDADIEAFCANHRLSHDAQLLEADFWSPAQIAFLTEALEADADWAEFVDQLDARLRG